MKNTESVNWKDLRGDRTLQEVARLSGYGVATINGLEKRGEGSRRLKVKLAEIYGWEPDYILNPQKYRAPFTDGIAASDAVKAAGGTEKQQNAAFNAAVKSGTERLMEEQDHSPRAVLKRAREAKGLSPQQFAKQLGYSKVSTYLDIEDGVSHMGEKMLRKAADILGVDVSDLMSGSDHPIDRTPSVGTFGAVPDIRVPPGMKAKFVPLISLAECGPDMVWTDEGYNGEGVLAIDCTDPKAFAVKLSGDSMQPKYDAGDKAIVFPSAQLYNGDVVLAKLKEEHGGDVMIKLYQASGGTVTLSSYNPVYKDIVWPRTAFAFIYPVDQILHSLRNRNR